MPRTRPQTMEPQSCSSTSPSARPTPQLTTSRMPARACHDRSTLPALNPTAASRHRPTHSPCSCVQSSMCPCSVACRPVNCSCQRATNWSRWCWGSTAESAGGRARRRGSEPVRKEAMSSCIEPSAEQRLAMTGNTPRPPLSDHATTAPAPRRHRTSTVPRAQLWSTLFRGWGLLGLGLGAADGRD